MFKIKIWWGQNVKIEPVKNLPVCTAYSVTCCWWHQHIITCNSPQKSWHYLFHFSSGSWCTGISVNLCKVTWLVPSRARIWTQGILSLETVLWTMVKHSLRAKAVGYFHPGISEKRMYILSSYRKNKMPFNINTEKCTNQGVWLDELL